MKQLSPLDRILLSITGLLAAYQVAVGIESSVTLPVIAYTVAFGVLLVAGLLLIILGFAVLDSPVVVIVSSIIPLSLSLGLVWEYLPAHRALYLVFAIAGFLAIIFTRLASTSGRFATAVLAITHGMAGMTIFLLPLSIVIAGRARAGFALIAVGGGLIGVGGLLLAFFKADKPVISGEIILKVLPGLLFLMTACFVAGFAMA